MKKEAFLWILQKGQALGYPITVPVKGNMLRESLERIYDTNRNK